MCDVATGNQNLQAVLCNIAYPDACISSPSVRDCGQLSETTGLKLAYALMLQSSTSADVSNLITVQPNAIYSVYYISVGNSTYFGC